MLENLEILNGEISPNFDSLNNMYSVNVTNEVSSLEFIYDCENCEVEIINNEILLEGLNEVYINVYSENNLEIYTFLVTREVSQSVFMEETLAIEENLDSTSLLIENYQVEQLIILCIILIIIVFKILFHKKRVNKI